MKRKTTILEQKLIDSGFSLSYKTYKGKNSKRTEFYVYNGIVENYCVVVYLDYKRENLDHYLIENHLPQYIGKENLEMLEKVYNEMFDLLYGGVEQEEIVEILEIEND